LKASTSSAFEMLWGGVYSPVAAMTACGKTTVPMMRADLARRRDGFAF